MLNILLIFFVLFALLLFWTINLQELAASLTEALPFSRLSLKTAAGTIGDTNPNLSTAGCSQLEPHYFEPTISLTVILSLHPSRIYH